MPWHSCGDYDTLVYYKPVLELLGSKPDVIHVGSRAGNVCDIPLSALDTSADGLVSGPPCPPYSTIGKRLCTLDPRSAVFVCVATWVLHLIHHGSLRWWIIENVLGIRKRKHGETESFADWFVREMRNELPVGWQLDVVEHCSSLTGVPQKRGRVFFVGTSPALRATPLQRRLLRAPPVRRPAADIVELLDQAAQADDWELLTLRQQVNLLAQLDAFRATEASRTTIGICDVARDPLRKMDGDISTGRTKTLRTNCSHLWILPGHDAAHRHIFGDKGRLLNRSEKCRLSGMVPSSLRDLTSHEVDVAVGNTIPVPLIGCILYPVLRCWVESLRPTLEGDTSAE